MCDIELGIFENGIMQVKLYRLKKKLLVRVNIDVYLRQTRGKLK